MKREIKDLEQIIEYCERIKEYLQTYGNDEDDFLGNRVFQEGSAFCLIQIGEAVGRLPEEIKVLSEDTEWNGIKGFRNILVHRYGTIWLENVWRTITVDVPILKRTCDLILRTLKGSLKE